MSNYTLPKLRYEYSALEPYISKRVLELHHDAHHAAYVKNANAALAALEKSRAEGDLARLPALEKALAFNLSGHIMHSLFWQNMMPQGGGQPQGDLAKTIDRDFGGFDKFKRQLTQAANTDMGSGWAALVWEPARRASFDRADPRPPVPSDAVRHPADGAGRLGARLLPAVREPEGRVLRCHMERLELA